MALENYLLLLRHHEPLSSDLAYQCLQIIFSGQCSTLEIKELLGLLADKGETYDEIVGFVRAMRDHMVRISLPCSVLDIVGTGGYGKPRYNISTSAAFVLATGQVPVAKHGNRGSHQANGSFDFLESLGISFHLTVAELVALFEKTKLIFLFARNHHPAMKHVAQARKELARRTIFNLIGPLSNPAQADYLVIGATQEDTQEKLARALQLLGVKKALVVGGYDHIDELSTVGDSIIFEVTPQAIQRRVFSPTSLGIRATESDLIGADSKTNAILFQQLISQNMVAHPISQLICLNAGAGFYCSGKTDSIEAGYLLAQKVFPEVYSFFTNYQQFFKKF